MLIIVMKNVVRVILDILSIDFDERCNAKPALQLNVPKMIYRIPMTVDSATAMNASNKFHPRQPVVIKISRLTVVVSVGIQRLSHLFSTSKPRESLHATRCAYVGAFCYSPLKESFRR